ncbi:Heat stress transcription factor B-4 [Nymphaea thermarum]|nr:Heat stress transcription factor B-4 [Nymphaea thermarum]
MALLLENCDGVLLSVDSHKAMPAPFLTKTYQLVDDPSTDHIVSWGQDDSTFVGFRKIVPDRWEFANDFFKKGEQHLLCEIHRRKTSQPPPPPPPIPLYRHHSSLFPFLPRSASVPSADPDDLQPPLWYVEPPLSATNVSPPPPVVLGNAAAAVSALSEDNERLRRSNSLLLSELAHMKKLYNDIIYFVQNHVQPVSPSGATAVSSMLPPPKVGFPTLGFRRPSNTCSTSGSSSITMGEEQNSKTRLFGVPLHFKKRAHPESNDDDEEYETSYSSNRSKEDLGLGLNLTIQSMHAEAV